ncbi:MAG TPA: alpha/beta hydrolase [Bryobacteraceae bacterium]|nr:alpha/beta hydrolase [Bryobacteraceae bacterium]
MNSVDDLTSVAATSVKTSDGIILSVSDRGSGSVIVLVHGWAMDSDMWEYQIPALISSGFRCVSYDQRGCGRSSRPGEGYDFDRLADDLADVLEQRDLSAVTLVGFSLAGGVIARYLSRHGSARICSAVLVAANTPYLLKADDNPDGMDRALVYDHFLAGLQTDRPKLLAEVAPGFFGTGRNGVPASAEIIGWALSLCHRSDAYAMLELYKKVNQTDFRSDMSAFDIPTLLIHGDEDPFQPLEYTARRAAAMIPNSRLQIYVGASHGLFFTHKSDLNRDLADFARNTQRGSTAAAQS